MPIVTLQRTLREIGRIRLGERNGNRPTKLDRFRFTSADQNVIAAAAELYGGNPRRWEGAPVGEQWEVTSNATHLPVIVPPGPAALSQWYETWSGGGCTRRCDGVTEVLTDSHCLCDTEEERTCKATTRLSVILADLPGLGVWRLETHSYYAATELAGTVDVLHQAAGRGQLLPAVLGMSPRQVKRVVNGKPQTMNFVVPTLDIPLTPGTLGIGTSSQPSGNWQAIAAPADDEPKAITAGEMEQAITHPGKAPAKPRANAAPPIPSTGIRPRPAAVQTVEINEARKAAVDVGDDPNAAMLDQRYPSRAKALTDARRIAKERGWDLPATFDEILGNGDLYRELVT
jgi:hypothetical protein